MHFKTSGTNNFESMHPYSNAFGLRPLIALLSMQYSFANNFTGQLNIDRTNWTVHFYNRKTHLVL